MNVRKLMIPMAVVCICGGMLMVWSHPPAPVSADAVPASTAGRSSVDPVPPVAVATVAATQGLATERSAPPDSAAPRAANDALALSVLTYSPTVDDRNSWRDLEVQLAAAGESVRFHRGLSADQWSAIRSLANGTRDAGRALSQQRSLLVHELAMKRFDSGQGEVLHESLDREAFEALPMETKRDIANSYKPNLPGQQVSFRCQGGSMCVVRVNPGDSADIDAVSADLRHHAATIRSGLEQILGRQVK